MHRSMGPARAPSVGIESSSATPRCARPVAAPPHTERRTAQDILQEVAVPLVVEAQGERCAKACEELSHAFAKALSEARRGVQQLTELRKHFTADEVVDLLSRQQPELANSMSKKMRRAESVVNLTSYSVAIVMRV